jgi:hypothetical protein
LLLPYGEKSSSQFCMRKINWSHFAASRQMKQKGHKECRINNCASILCDLSS